MQEFSIYFYILFLYVIIKQGFNHLCCLALLSLSTLSLSLSPSLLLSLARYRSMRALYIYESFCSLIVVSLSWTARRRECYVQLLLFKRYIAIAKPKAYGLQRSLCTNQRHKLQQWRRRERRRVIANRPRVWLKISPFHKFSRIVLQGYFSCTLQFNMMTTLKCSC